MRIKAPSKKKVVVAAAILAVWAYLSNVTLALRREGFELNKVLVATEAQISEATAEMKMLDRRQKTAAKNSESFEWANHLLASLPRPYMVEMPLKIAGIMKGNGIEHVEVRLAQLFPVRELADHALARWELRIAKGRVLSFGQTLAEIENDFTLGSVRSLAIRRVNSDGSCEIACDFETIVHP